MAAMFIGNAAGCTAIYSSRRTRNRNPRLRKRPLHPNERQFLFQAAVVSDSQIHCRKKSQCSSILVRRCFDNKLPMNLLRLCT
jgi:hypothetical protein